jgi:hypothetical protein
MCVSRPFCHTIPTLQSQLTAAEEHLNTYYLTQKGTAVSVLN